MRNLYFIRHGDVEMPGGQRRCVGASDYPLSALGRLRAVLLAPGFESRELGEVFVSPLSRARETAELMGAEAILEQRCARREDYEWICGRIHRVEQVALDMRVDLRGTQPSPGNIAGGLTTIEEKSLGGICKIGSNPIVDVLDFAESAQVPGVSFMDTPGNDLACSLGLSAGGAQMIFFSTGRGTPMGFAASPMIKITANGVLAAHMAENIDVDLSGIIERTLSLRAGGDLLFDTLLRVAQGEETASERLGHREFGLYRISPILT